MKNEGRKVDHTLKCLSNMLDFLYSFVYVLEHAILIIFEVKLNSMQVHKDYFVEFLKKLVCFKQCCRCVRVKIQRGVLAFPDLRFI